MKFVKFIITLAITAGFTYLLNTSLPTKPAPTPPFGKLFNPFTGFWQNAESIKDSSTESFNFSTLSDKVEVVYDERMVPHIFAENVTDALFVQGFITAQNRLWQMDISIRGTVGRLAEIMGERLIERDKQQRRKGMGFAAMNALNAWKKNPDNFRLIQAYTQGVNTYILSLQPKDYPVEFKILDYQPELWTEEKSAIFVKSMAESLCFREDDLEATNALKALGREAFDFLYPEYNPKQSPIIPMEQKWEFEAIKPDSIDASRNTRISEIQYRPFEKPDPFLGSNNWAVAGSKTANGNPILCNDPHLQLTLPSIWYEVQIHTPQFNTYGVSLPGLPGVIIGFNEHIAWGQTNVGHDVTDWYSIDWVDDKKQTYLLDDNPTSVKWRLEKIFVKGANPIIDSVKYTVWGPVVYETEGEYQDMALRWLAHDETSPEEINAFFKLASAKNYDDYSDAISGYVAPAQNFVFASKEGDIAIKVNGRLPVKRKEQGRFVQDGSQSQNAWSGYIPMNQIPQVKNPARGFVSSANQHSTAVDYPYYYNGGFEDYRGRILNRKLAAMDDITIDDMKDLQNDTYSLKAEEVLPILITLIEDSNKENKESNILQSLKDWKYSYDKDSPAPIYFEVWYRDFYKRTWDEIYTLNEERPMLFPESWRLIELLEQDPENKYFDDISTPEKETAKDIAIQSFQAMTEKVAELKEEYDELRWDQYKKTRINHLGRIPAFTSDIVEVGGSGDALNAISRSAGPSWRMIVELGEQVDAYGIYPGGQSGNPGSPFYESMIKDWADGNYYKLHFIKRPQDLGEKTLLVQKFN